MYIKQVRAVLGDRLSQALLGFYAFTGYDSMSAFSRRGTTGPLKQLKKGKQTMDTFINLGKSWDITQLVNDKLQAFTYHMYASSSKTTKVNVLRHVMFLTKRGEVDSSTFPPCEDSLLQHTHRANYQAGYGRGLCNETLICQNPLVMVG